MSDMFTYGNTTVAVGAPEAILAWLDHFLRPWFERIDGPATRRVELAIDPAAHDRAAEGSDDARSEETCFVLDTHVVRHPIAGQWDGRRWIFDRQLDVAYGVDESGAVSIVASADGPGPRVALMRVVREIALVDALVAGRPLLHAAVVAGATGAIAICGRKRAGKSSLMLHLLGDGRAAFVANDRAMVDRSDGRLVVRGMPTITALRADAVERFPAVAGTLRSAPDRHWLTPAESASRRDRPWAAPTHPIDLAPARLCELLGVQPRALAPLRGLVFPYVDESTEGIVLRQLDPIDSRARLDGAQVGAGAPAGSFFANGADQTAGDAARDAELERLSHLPSVEARLGRGAFEHPLTVDDLLARAA